MDPGQISTVRVGRHTCFDRLVITVAGQPSGYDIKYVDEVTADASGAAVTVPGGARLQFVIRHPWTAAPTPGVSVVNVAGFRTLRSVVAAGSFEGITTLGVGVRARLPFVMFTLTNPSRVVVDFYDHW